LFEQRFFHRYRDKSVYCERLAPGEETKTCREAGARVVFEKKLQEEDAWKLYKRAYKKYYARVMKGNMSREDFNAWVEFAAGRRDAALLLLEGAKSAEEKAGLIKQGIKRDRLRHGIPSRHIDFEKRNRSLFYCAIMQEGGEGDAPSDCP